MLLKARKKPVEMEVLESLEGRVRLAPDLERQLSFMRTGFGGEVGLDVELAGLDDCVVRIGDFVLAGNQVCQIDTVLVSAGGIYLLDVKNWSGRHTVGAGGFEGLVNDPLDQLKRAGRLFGRMLERERISLPVETRLVFVNPGMTLYGVQAEMPIVLPQQIPEYLAGVRRAAGVLTEWEERAAQRIVACHSDENPYRLKVAYTWDEVGKGMLCAGCRRVMVEKSHKYVVCGKCGMVEAKGDALKRTKRELDILFPGCVPEVDRLYRFCGGMVSKRGIFKALRN
ncbi:nuclease-related domain-containing protein [Jeotgalibaca sp. A122]|uniref:nuclease-related domain-containing protein n=1 Tax=Jeotgalibaca sp. A122 TaxID=3457322 RepID=UPI003FD19129